MILSHFIAFSAVLCLLCEAQTTLPKFENFALLLQHMPPLLLRMFELCQLVRVIFLAYGIFDHLPMVCHKLLRLFYRRQFLARIILFQERPYVLRTDGFIVDETWKRIHMTIEINDDVGTITCRQHVTPLTQRLNK